MKPATVNRKAKELMDNGKIAARIAALHAVHQKRQAVTVDSLTSELEQTRGLALDVEQPSVVVQATMSQGEAARLIIEKVEATGKDGAPLVPELPLDGSPSCSVVRCIALRLLRLSDNPIGQLKTAS